MRNEELSSEGTPLTSFLSPAGRGWGIGEKAEGSKLIADGLLFALHEIRFTWGRRWLRVSDERQFQSPGA
jgi:hypothetical protein